MINEWISFNWLDCRAKNLFEMNGTELINSAIVAHTETRDTKYSDAIKQKQYKIWLGLTFGGDIAYQLRWQQTRNEQRKFENTCECQCPTYYLAG